MANPKSESHPTFGMISANRWTAGGRGVRLFGSRIPGHNTGVTLTIREATRKFDLGYESTSAAGGAVLAQVELSPNQWSELLTSMNVGEGVPCTIRFVKGDGKETRGDPPGVDPEPERVRQEFARKVAASADRIRDARATAAAKLRGKVPATLAKEIDDAFGQAEQELRSNAPWYVKQFTEATERVANAVKAEVDAFLTGVATQLGVKSLRDTGLAGLLGRDDGDGR